MKNGCPQYIFVVWIYNKVGMMTLVNYLSIVGVELPFFQVFKNLFLPSYFSDASVYIPIKALPSLLYYFITQDT